MSVLAQNVPLIINVTLTNVRHILKVGYYIDLVDFILNDTSLTLSLLS